MNTESVTIASNPRATAKTLPNYVEKNVLVIGKVDQVEDTEVTLELSDGKIIVHIGTALPPLELGNVYEFMGKVVDDSSMKALSVVNIRADSLPNAELEQRLGILRAGMAGRELFNKA